MPPTFDGVFVHSGVTNPTTAVFHAPEAMNISEIKLWSEIVRFGVPANGFDVTVNSVIGGATNFIGSFIFSGPSMVETIYTPSALTLQMGDMIEILYGNNGNHSSDHGNVNVFISSSPVPEPGTIFLVASGLIGLAAFRRKKIRKRIWSYLTSSVET